MGWGGLSALRSSPRSRLDASPLPPQLSNRLFEELAMDVYDEVDRRENDAGERGWGRLLGVRPPAPGWVLAAVPARGGAEPGTPPDPIRTAGPSFLIPRAGAEGRFL